VILEGDTFAFAGEVVLEAPVELAGGCTRKRVTVAVGAASAPTEAVRRHDGRVFLVLPGRLAVPAGARVRLEVEPRADGRSIEAPADLARVLAVHGLHLDPLPAHERRHLVSMVREARDPTVRAERIAAVIERLREGSRPEPTP